MPVRVPTSQRIAEQILDGGAINNHNCIFPFGLHVDDVGEPVKPAVDYIMVVFTCGCRVVTHNNKERDKTMAKAKVWRNAEGGLVHDSCFEEGESREGYEEVDINELDKTDECDTCMGPIVEEPDADLDSDEDDLQAP